VYYETEVLEHRLAGGGTTEFESIRGDDEVDGNLTAKWRVGNYDNRHAVQWHTAFEIDRKR